jgi:glycosyltransferase involved in cell wall biosynthesis
MKSLKIVAYVHGYFPNHNAGAEAMLHQILFDLKKKGHEVKVITKNPGASEYEGIPLHLLGGGGEREVLMWADVIFTHLDRTKDAVITAKILGKPIVHLVHNDKQLSYNQINNRSAQLAIANSEWISKTIRKSILSTIVYPPTIPERYEVETSREAIVLINMNEAKGGKIFWQLARIFPDRKFIGVKGAYGEQIGYEKDLPNVTILENTPDIQEVYKKARLVIMPSSYESWGRVAIEASCSGIPVIAAPTPGLTESLDYSGHFAEHDDVAGWVEQIIELDDPKVYEKYSKLAKKRAKEVADAFEKQMEDLNEKLVTIVEEWHK